MTKPREKKAIEQVLLSIAQKLRRPTAAEEIATHKIHSTPAPPALPTLSTKVLVEIERATPGMAHSVLKDVHGKVSGYSQTCLWAHF